MLRKLILSTAVAGVASALGGAAPGLAQDVGVFGEGPDRICNTVIDSSGKPVVETVRPQTRCARAAPSPAPRR